MIDVSIFDRNFLGDPCSCHGKVSKYINWNRPENYSNVKDICFFTDLCMEQVNNVNCKRKILWIMEPRSYSPQIYSNALSISKKFDYVLSYDDFLLTHGKNFLFYPWGSSWVGVRDDITFKKTKNFSIIASPKTLLEGHKLRHQIIQEHKTSIDAYGANYINLPIKDGKKLALDAYRYSFTLENCRIDNYFTEKLIDCFLCKTIPIYWGAPNIDKFFDTRGMIVLNNINEIYDILLKCDENYYNSKIEYINNNYELAKKYLISEDWIYENYPFLFKIGI